MIQTRLSIMMFLQFFIWGAFFVPMGGYLGKLFVSYKGELNSIIGSTYATQTWAALFAPLIVGFVADRLFNKERVNGILHLLGGGLLLLVQQYYGLPDGIFLGDDGFFPLLHAHPCSGECHHVPKREFDRK